MFTTSWCLIDQSTDSGLSQFIQCDDSTHFPKSSQDQNMSAFVVLGDAADYKNTVAKAYTGSTENFEYRVSAFNNLQIQDLADDADSAIIQSFSTTVDDSMTFATLIEAPDSEGMYLIDNTDSMVLGPNLFMSYISDSAEIIRTMSDDSSRDSIIPH